MLVRVLVTVITVFDSAQNLESLSVIASIQLNWRRMTQITKVL